MKKGQTFLAMLLLSSSSGWAGGVVTNCTESNLQAAMAGAGTVTFACDGTITLSSPISVLADTVLDAQGRQVTISGGNTVGIFYVGANARFTLLNLTLLNGRRVNGGAIYNDGGTFNATNCTFLANWATGADGAFPGGTGGSAGGGAIYNGGVLSANLCAFRLNQAVAGNGGGGVTNQGSPTVAAGAGGSAGGGALYNVGVMALDRCLLASNNVVGGAGGSGSDQTLSFPTSGYEATDGAAGGSASGGALFNAGTGSLVNCTVSWHLANGGAGGNGGRKFPSPIGGDIGRWGGIGGDAVGGVYMMNGVLNLTNCTLALNSGVGGHGGDGGWANVLGRGGTGGAGSGGVFRSNGMVNLINCVAALNSGVGGVGGYGCQGHSYDRWCGYFPPGYSAGNFRGTITDLGHNLSSDGSAVLSASGSYTNIDPKLGPLADNGGGTLTMALLSGSPGIDAADTGASPSTDQRGIARPLGSAADIGAFEAGWPPVLEISQAGATQLEIFVRSLPGQICRLLTSSNGSTWVPICTNQTGVDGTGRIVLSFEPGETCRFYRLAVP